MVNVGRVVRSKRLGCQRITVKRYAASWQDGAYTRDDSNPIVFAVAAIVTVAQAKDLQLVPEGDRVTGAMKFLTNVELHATNGEAISDELIWRGARYKILTVTPDIDYGFYRSIGTRLDGDGIG
jgi:hypothetical protein